MLTLLGDLTGGFPINAGVFAGVIHKLTSSSEGTGRVLIMKGEPFAIFRVTTQLQASICSYRLKDPEARTDAMS